VAELHRRLEFSCAFPRGGGGNLRQQRHYAYAAWKIAMVKFLASYFAADSILLAFDAKQLIKANSSD
jgi:hypothetical protein